MESHFLLVCNIVAFASFAEITWCFAREERSGVERFYFFINNFVKCLIAMTRALPKFNWILLMMWEESLKFFENRWYVDLVRIRCRIKNIFSRVDWVSNNDDFWNTIVACGLINTTPDGEQFGFYARDIGHMMESFGDRFIVDVCMRYESSDIIFDASIHDDKSMRRGARGFDSQVVKLLNTCFEAIIFLFIK